MIGWISLHRKLLENSIFSSEKGLKIWIWCLLKTTHKEQSFYTGRKKIVLKEGQFMFGRNKASIQLEMSGSTIWYWINQLCDDNYLDIKKTTQYSIITIKNWKKYQTVDRDIDNRKTTEKQQKDTYNNDNNDNNDNKGTLQSADADGINQIIDLFYNSINPTINYGNKTNRTSAIYLINKFGLEGTIKMTKLVISLQGKKYVPTVTTPYQLKEKLADIKIYIEREKNNNTGIPVI